MDLSCTPICQTVFAAVDVETTGLFPRVDRVIEVAVVRVDAGGHVLERYETLLNPDRDLGPTEIHGIHAADVQQAPVFAAIASDLIECFAGAVVVGHNIGFDFRFLQAEFARAGIGLPEILRICTLQMAWELELPSRRLADCCGALGVSLDHQHRAAADAEATANLFLKLAARAGAKTLQDVGCRGEAVIAHDGGHHPLVPPCPRLTVRDAIPSRNYLAGLVGRLPHASGRGGADGKALPYLELLDRVLEDRRILDAEADSLFQLAGELGLSRDEVERAHAEYFQRLTEVAAEDGVITEMESRDLSEVKKALGIAADIPAVGAIGRCTATPTRATELRGLSVCFTGAMQCRYHGSLISRETAEELASAAGLVVQAGVTKGLDLLVVADPNSMSAKAKKARQYGTRILAEQIFWRKLRVPVQ